MKTITTIEGENVYLMDDGSVNYKAKAAVDTDGIGPLHGDTCAQNETSLKWNGKSLNADEDIYIVVPPAILNGVRPIVLGCQARCTNVKNGRTTDAVVGDIGPHKKLGEISVACSKALGIDPSPTSGGTDEHIVHYSLTPGVAAAVNGKHYDLQPA